MCRRFCDQQVSRSSSFYDISSTLRLSLVAALILTPHTQTPHATHLQSLQFSSDDRAHPHHIPPLLSQWRDILCLFSQQPQVRGLLQNRSLLNRLLSKRSRPPSLQPRDLWPHRRPAMSLSKLMVHMHKQFTTIHGLLQNEPLHQWLCNQ